MKYLEFSFSTPEENLACDEALLDLSEEGSDAEVLRFWEPQNYFVVLGYSRKIHSELDLESCQKHGIPILRRSSGGGTVLQGPGCLNYSLILNIENSRSLQTITETNRYILNRHKKSIESILGKTIQVRGISDLVLDNLKFSGNAQRRKKKFVLFHGTFLLNFKISLIEEVLTIPVNQPDYRKNRTHCEFLANLNLPDKEVKGALIQSWEALEPFNRLPVDKINRLVQERYSKQEWNFKY